MSGAVAILTFMWLMLAAQTYTAYRAIREYADECSRPVLEISVALCLTVFSWLVTIGVTLRVAL